MRDRDYMELMDKDKMKLCANGALEQYNGNADKPMNLVLFNFAIEHLLRISRIMQFYFCCVCCFWATQLNLISVIRL